MARKYKKWRVFLSALFIFFGIFIVLFSVSFKYFLYVKAQNVPLSPIFNLKNYDDVYDIFFKDSVILKTLFPHDVAKLFYSKLDNQLIFGEEKFIISSIIENHPDSRKQMKGLSKASVVFETLAEGGITRFLAVFSYQNIEKFGPVRSVRQYFLEIAEGFGGALSHAGGSPEAIQNLQKSSLTNLEGLYYEEVTKMFFRDKNYYAPHNLFANLNELKKLLEKKKIDQNLHKSFFYFNDNADFSLYPDAKNIEIDFSHPAYKVRFEYDLQNAIYKRFLSEKPHIDSIDNSQISPSNIVVLFVDYKVYDSHGRLKMNIVGEGNAFYFVKGKFVKGSFEKKSDTDKFYFYDEKKNEIPFLSGQTWICIVKNENAVKADL